MPVNVPLPRWRVNAISSSDVVTTVRGGTVAVRAGDIPLPGARRPRPPSGREGGDQLADGVDRLVERDTLVGRELDLEHPLEAAPAEDHGHAHVQPVDPELALEVGGAGQDALPVAEDRIDHLERGRGG